jgi:non-homologous end joining protein Ku
LVRPRKRWSRGPSVAQPFEHGRTFSVLRSIIKGYEVAKGGYIELDPEELEAVALESKRTIEIDEFVPGDLSIEAL